MAKLDDKMAALATMSPAQQREEWSTLFDSDAPRLGPDLIRHMLGHRLQEKAMGGLPAAVSRRLRAIASDKADAPELKPGTRLMRSWHGRSIAVTVTEKGFDFHGRSYSSLTAIAREVTGAAWSGPRFFGLQAGQGAKNG